MGPRAIKLKQTTTYTLLVFFSSNTRLQTKRKFPFEHITNCYFFWKCEFFYSFKYVLRKINKWIRIFLFRFFPSCFNLALLLLEHFFSSLRSHQFIFIHTGVQTNEIDRLLYIFSHNKHFKWFSISILIYMRLNIDVWANLIAPWIEIQVNDC